MEQISAGQPIRSRFWTRMVFDPASARPGKRLPLFRMAADNDCWIAGGLRLSNAEIRHGLTGTNAWDPMLRLVTTLKNAS